MIPGPAVKSFGAVLLASTLFSAHAGGLPPAQPKLLPPEQAFRFSARALDPTTVEARFDVADGYYLYRDKLRFTVDARCRAAAPSCRPASRKHDEFFGDVETYRGVVVVKCALSSAAAGQTLTVHADSQGCADVGVCYPPNPQELRVVVPGPGASPVRSSRPGARSWFR